MLDHVEDTKYIVFKRDEFREWWGQGSVGGTSHPKPPPEALDDAVVIRTKDPFAGPALHSYAATMALYVNLAHVNGDDADGLRRTSDYFHERAMEADATFDWKLPD